MFSTFYFWYFFYFHVQKAPVFGNFTEEDANSGTQSQDNSIEYPLQRDEVQTTPNKGERNHVPQSKCNITTYHIYMTIEQRLSTT
jgi:hypothetical protein